MPADDGASVGPAGASVGPVAGGHAAEPTARRPTLGGHADDVASVGPVAGGHAAEPTATGPTFGGDADATPDLGVGVGPHPQPWPDDANLDRDLLREGDRRNVVDRYRYWRLDAIVADLDQHRHDFAVAIENWQHDANIGTVVRTANAFNAGEVVIVGRRRWNRRGAMVTDRYMHVVHVPDVAALAAHAQATGRVLVAIDNGPDARPIEAAALPLRALFVFGQEGPGLTDEARAAATALYSIAQYGSTRSINAGVAAGIAMHAWVRQHAAPAG